MKKPKTKTNVPILVIQSDMLSLKSSLFICPLEKSSFFSIRKLATSSRFCQKFKVLEKSYYEVLGLKRSATQKEIRDAYISKTQEVQCSKSSHAYFKHCKDCKQLSKFGKLISTKNCVWRLKTVLKFKLFKVCIGPYLHIFLGLILNVRLGLVG